MGGWPVASTPPHTDKTKVNPFMQWAVINSIQGFYFTGPQQQGSGPAPPSDLSGGGGSSTPAPAPVPTSKEDQDRPVTLTVTGDTSRQIQTMAPAHYNHTTTLHPMLPVDPNHHHHQQPQQPQQHHQHQPPHQQQQQQPQAGELGPQGTIASHGNTNDTAFPGGHHRQDYSLGAGGQAGPQQPGQMVQHNNLNTKQLQTDKSTNSLTKNKLYTEENGQIVTFNGSQEHMEMNRRGIKIERVYECKDCDKAFTREEHLKRHAKSHTDEPVHRCEVLGCSKAYTRKERLTRHYKVAHLGQEPERPFWCPECGKDFQRKEHLIRHQRNLHGPGCSVGLPQHAQQAGHQTDTDGPISMTVLNPLNSNTHHPGGAQGQATNSPLLHCTYEGCTKTYSRREHLNRHLKLHMGIEPERPYYCLDCGKTFTRKEHLLRHRRGHTGETPFHCPGPDCTKQFARKEHLKRHMRVHTGEHPYPCSECGRSFGRRERLLKHMKSHGIGVMPTGVRPQPQYQQPKKEFKKEPEFNADVDFLDPNPQTSQMTHGVFGDQTNQLLRMIAQKGPLSPEQLGMGHPAPPTEQVFSNPEVARALSNPDIVRAFSNPDVVKAFALSPPKKSATSPGGSSISQATLTTVQAAAPSVTRGPDIANSPSVPPELSKLPSGFSIFPVVPSTGGSQVVTGTTQETVPGGQVCVSNNGNTYYQAAPSYVAASVPHRAELTTIPMAWPGWHMTAAQPVNMRSPAKVEPADSKYWEPTAAYFRAPIP